MVLVVVHGRKEANMLVTFDMDGGTGASNNFSKYHRIYADDVAGTTSLAGSEHSIHVLVVRPLL